MAPYCSNLDGPYHEYNRDWPRLVWHEEGIASPTTFPRGLPHGVSRHKRREAKFLPFCGLEIDFCQVKNRALGNDF